MPVLPCEGMRYPKHASPQEKGTPACAQDKIVSYGLCFPGSAGKQQTSSSPAHQTIYYYLMGWLLGFAKLNVRSVLCENTPTLVMWFHRFH